MQPYNNQPSTDLHLHTTSDQRFYRLILNEITDSNGKRERNEIKVIIHSTLTRLDNPNYYSLHLETFKRQHRSTWHSVSVKNFLERLSLIIDDVKLIIEKNGRISKIENLKEIQNKAQTQVDKLRLTYKGKHVEDACNFQLNFHKNEKIIINDFYKYHNFGLLFCPYYKIISLNNNVLTYQLRYANLMEHTLVYVEEELEQINTIEDFGEIELQIKGKLIEPINTEMFRSAAKIAHFPFSEEDCPQLDKYKGGYLLDKHTKIVKQAKYHIEFSFGEKYRKSITYELKNINHEEI